MHANPNGPCGAAAAGTKYTLSVTPDQADLIRHALADRFKDYAELAVADVMDFVGEHGGEGIAAADAASKANELLRIAELLEQRWVPSGRA